MALVSPLPKPSHSWRKKEARSKLETTEICFGLPYVLPGILEQLEMSAQEREDAMLASLQENEQSLAPGAKRQRMSDSLDGGEDQQLDPPKNVESASLFADTTVVLGDGLFALVKRLDQAVPAYYVYCPLHSYVEFVGGVRKQRHCCKSMGINRPDENTVLLRLRRWVLEGSEWK